MIPSSPRQTLAGATLLIAGVVCEIAAAIAMVAPELAPNFPALSWHLSAAILGAAGAALLVTSGLGTGQGVTLGAMFFILAGLIPGAGLLVVGTLAATLRAHRFRKRPATPALHVLCPRGPQGVFGKQVPGGFEGYAPLVSVLGTLDPGTLQSVTLGLAPLPERLTRPLLTRVKNHPDVRVHLYANGLRNDQLETPERRLAVLKERAAENPGDSVILTDIVETYLHLFDHDLIPADERATTARRALRDTEVGVAIKAENAAALAGLVRFHLILGEFQDAAALIAQLRLLPGQSAAVAALEARLQFEANANEPVPRTPVPPRVASNPKRKLA